MLSISGIFVNGELHMVVKPRNLEIGEHSRFFNF